jgi:DNA-binding response OmpR family regulator
MYATISVLVVEDEEHIRGVLEYNLRFDGFEVHLAGSGRDALEIARSARPDVVFWIG